tara:strand:+ start:3150 stop:3911 length:762 start_codon:yes stop_codon:yes gene_type:complete
MSNIPEIPKNIFQTHKTRKYIQNNERLLKATNSWKKNKNFKYHFYDNNECEAFIKEHFPEVYEAYNKCPLNVMKADLWRYCIIYKYGGIYADADTIMHEKPMLFIKPKQLVVVPENDTHFCQWVFAAPPNSPILKSVIDLSVERLLSMNEIKGEHVIHYSTGPGVFTDGIVLYLLDNFKDVPTSKEFINCYVNKSYARQPGKQMSGNIYKYENNKIPDMFVFKHDKFHKHIVQHLFSGQWKDGWCKERKVKLC